MCLFSCEMMNLGKNAGENMVSARKVHENDFKIYCTFCVFSVLSNSGKYFFE